MPVSPFSLRIAAGRTHALLPLLALSLAACGYGFQRPSNQYPPSSGGAVVGNGGAAPISSPLLPDEYVVQAGDTVSAIAARRGLDTRDLAGWNDLDQNFTIFPGQLLRLSPPTYRNPVSAAAGTVAYPPSEASGGTQGVALPVRGPLARPVPIGGSAAVAPGGSVATGVVETAQPVAFAPAGMPVFAPVEPGPPTTRPPAAGTGSRGVGYSPIAPGEVPIVAPSREQAAMPPTQPPASLPVAPRPMVVVPPAPAASPPAASATPSAVSTAGWRWPLAGSVVKTYAPGSGAKGIDIATAVGTPVRASAGGRVAYSGSALKGYGELVVIKHDEVYLTAYGFNRKRLVKEGEQVKAGQVIAESGTGPDQTPVLHFEIREYGNPVDPLPLLPAR